MTDHMRVSGGTHAISPGAEAEPAPDMDRIRAVAAEIHAEELVIVCQNAIAGLPHWRRDMQALLRRIAEVELREPRQ